MFNLNATLQDANRLDITSNYYQEESDSILYLLSIIDESNFDSDNPQIANLAINLVENIRRIKQVPVDQLMQSFKLSTPHGIALMSLAESLLRIPDIKTQDMLIKNKLTSVSWNDVGGINVKIFVSIVLWLFGLSSSILRDCNGSIFTRILHKAIITTASPIIRYVLLCAVKSMGDKFVLGSTITSALEKAKNIYSISIDNHKTNRLTNYAISYDMLGEAATNEHDANEYLNAYIDSIHQIAKTQDPSNSIYQNSGISVKLSAIYSKYSKAHHQETLSILYPRLKGLYVLAKQYNMSVFIDAEEADRLDLSLDLIAKLLSDKDLDGFLGFGIVVQAYQKRAIHVIKYLVALAKNNRIMVRLVKGAYWDYEIKMAQASGMRDYPVFTRKMHTDVSYLACACLLAKHQKEIYPAFATHNVHTMAFIYNLYKELDFEFQCLYGMGDKLYSQIINKSTPSNIDILHDLGCRVYAPVGNHQTLLAYLARRLLESGANSSFVNQLLDETIPIDELIACPIKYVKNYSQGQANVNFSLPSKIYNDEHDTRQNSSGICLTNEDTLFNLQAKLNTISVDNKVNYLAFSLVKGIVRFDDSYTKDNVCNPANHLDIVGQVIRATPKEVDMAIYNAKKAFHIWSNIEPDTRGAMIIKFANLLEENAHTLINLLVREAGKTIANAIAEIREAVDFCRYYASQVIREFRNDSHAPLGVIACISPWNFPLAIFIGEVCSALVSGNCVIAKPSYQTNLIAFYVVKLLYASGIPQDALQLILGLGSVLGDYITKNPDISGVIFTGSLDVAKQINTNLIKANNRAILIAETGGQNAMIVDSSALLEQVINDVVASGFDSAGQRCSALRVLYLEQNIYSRFMDMLKGTMDNLIVDSPTNIHTDVGPIIDLKSKNTIVKHIQHMQEMGHCIYQTYIDPVTTGTFVAPTIIEIDNINQLEQEVFGPVVHVIAFESKNLHHVVNEINNSKYGLTIGVHSRIDSVVRYVYENANVGNIYINRNMIGAVVGSQPFGGEGLSGTGPKAGGPSYLYRLVKTQDIPSQIKDCNHLEPADDANNVLNDINISISKDQAHKFSFNYSYIRDLVNQFIEHDSFTPDERTGLIYYANNILSSGLYLDKVISLPGITGEDNFMFYKPRGLVLCFARNKMDFAKQMLCSFLSGNRVLLPINQYTEIFATFNFIDNANIITLVDIDNAQEHVGEVSMTLVSDGYFVSNDYSKISHVLNNKQIITIIYEDDGYYNFSMLHVEKSVSINTTATGGNIELINL